ncbi:hypothetical protein TI39_contig71g00011 [Zymoseptoria brevis]|uniref:Uncharacterized protein n=1 Tax=Zymoseptoria brevis TaxID=1047168 RepID=A0A0F4H174_9PEZI|nr:hypothetical protein TI39_contig71g00011 [Zymoseptoria brevis]
MNFPSNLSRLMWITPSTDAFPQSRIGVTQSNVLKQFYASCGIYKADGLDGKVGTFRLAFANYGGIQYCDADPDCTNDGNQWNRDGEVTGDPAVKRELTHDTRAQRHYMTRRGQNIFVPDGAKVGDIVWTPKSYSEDLEFDMDEIVGTANATVV